MVPGPTTASYLTGAGVLAVGVLLPLAYMVVKNIRAFSSGSAWKRK